MREARSPEPFFDVPTVRQDTSQGTVEMPIRYYDASAVTLLYRVPEGAAAPLLEPHGLRAMSDRKGRATVAVTWFDYRRTSIGPYNELAVTVMAAPSSARRGGLRDLLSPYGLAGGFIVHLPVTTPIANAAGREIWGYPKIVAEMPVDFRNEVMVASLSHEGRRVVSARVPLQRGVMVPTPDISTLSVQGGRVIRTTIRTRCPITLTRGKGAQLTVEAPDHPVGYALEQLRVGEHPTAVLWTHRFQSILPFGVPIADTPTGG